jgi:hypothetical protein
MYSNMVPFITHIEFYFLFVFLVNEYLISKYENLLILKDIDASTSRSISPYPFGIPIPDARKSKHLIKSLDTNIT